MLYLVVGSIFRERDAEGWLMKALMKRMEEKGEMDPKRLDDFKRVLTKGSVGS